MRGIICAICEHCNPEMAGYCVSCEMPLNEPPPATPTKLRFPKGEEPPPAPKASDIVKAQLRAKTAVLPNSQNSSKHGPRSQKSLFASEWRIFLAWVIDGSILISVGLLVALGEVSFSTSADTEISSGIANWLFIHRQAVIHGCLSAIATGAIYETLVGRGRGLTLGRRISGLHLSNRREHPLSRLQILARSCLGCLSALCFGAGFFWAVVDSYGRTWHDLLCGTTLKQRASTSIESSK